MTAPPAPPIPDAALAVMEAAAEDYRLQLGEHATPHGVARRVAEYLVSSGYAIVPAEEAAP
jgi:hypothetical protein